MKAVIKKVPSGKLKGQYRFVLVGDNGEIIATSETYTQKHNVKDILAHISGYEITEIIDKTKETKETND